MASLSFYKPLNKRELISSINFRQHGYLHGTFSKINRLTGKFNGHSSCSKQGPMDLVMGYSRSEMSVSSLRISEE